MIPTGISMKGPAGTYIRIAPRSGLTVNKNLTTLAGVINRDYTGEIMVILQNFRKEEQTITKGDKIAQAILENAITPPTEEMTELPTTTRGSNGFGSSDLNISSVETDKANMSMDLNMTYERDAPFDLYFTSIPYDHYTTRTIRIEGNDKLLGMILQEQKHNISQQPQVIDIKASTPATKIKRWRMDLRNAYITKMFGIYTTENTTLSITLFP